MRGYFGANNPTKLPIVVHLNLPVRDFLSDPSHQSNALKLITEVVYTHSLDRCDHVILACNTAHLLAPQIESITSVKLNSLITNAHTEIKKRGVRQLGILASPTTLNSNIFSIRGVTLVRPSLKDTLKLESAIRGVIKGRNPNRFVKTIESVLDGADFKNMDAILLGCTEIEFIMQHSHDPKFIRPLELTVLSTLNP